MQQLTTELESAKKFHQDSLDNTRAECDRLHQAHVDAHQDKDEVIRQLQEQVKQISNSLASQQQNQQQQQQQQNQQQQQQQQNQQQGVNSAENIKVVPLHLNIEDEHSDRPAVPKKRQKKKRNIGMLKEHMGITAEEEY